MIKSNVKWKNFQLLIWFSSISNFTPFKYHLCLKFFPLSISIWILNAYNSLYHQNKINAFNQNSTWFNLFRLSNRDKVCDYYKDDDRVQAHSKDLFASYVFVLDKLNIIWCPIYKAATTTWIHNFLALSVWLQICQKWTIYHVTILLEIYILYIRVFYKNTRK